jgi:hypothetical protein
MNCVSPRGLPRALPPFKWRWACAALLVLVSLPAPVSAHGVLGDRFFPATITSDDPFAADELALPTFTSFNHEQDYEVSYSKSIFRGVALEMDFGYVDAHPPGDVAQTGWENPSVQPVMEFYRDAEGEFILAGGFGWEIGGSGSRAVADRSSTYSPTLKWGKGFGNLPDSLWFLKPFAATGTVSFAVSGQHGGPNAVEWAGAVEYSLLYLQNNVRDQGFSNFVARLAPVVEYKFTAPVTEGGGGGTGTINPGIIWTGQKTQFAVEAVIPANSASGKAVGLIAQVHFYIDDIFPHSLGRPIFEGSLL